MLEDVKLSLRINNTAFDAEINDLIDAAQRDLVIAGITLLSTTVTPDEIPAVPPETEPTQPADIKVMDSLIQRAITLYVKANFGWDNPDAERLQQSYVMLKQHLSLSGDYNVVE
ncbi:MAG: phage gp6-like head-tail connector protein [Tissierellia bacterium]|nr:phage gp6-like head-tail connector protein [Tissierellia bacterium]